MKSLIFLGVLLCSLSGFSQTRYFKAKNGKVITEKQFKKLSDENMANAVKWQKRNPKDKVVVKDNLVLVRSTNDSAIFTYDFKVDVVVSEIKN